MVDVSFATGEFGMLQSTLSDGKATVTLSASNNQDAAADLLAAVDRATAEGVAECFWPRASGMYRWLLRRDRNRARVVVLWSAGTLTGWESLFWAECDWEPLEDAIRSQVSPYAVTTNGA
jgi:hypothetical protein